MLLVLIPLAYVGCTVLRSQSALSILHVILPLPLIPVLLPIEQLSEAMALVSFPLAHVQVLIVVVAVASPLSQVLLPLPMVLVIGALLLVRAVKHALAISDIPPLGQDLALIVISIAIGVSGLDPAAIFAHKETSCCMLRIEVVPLVVI